MKSTLILLLILALFCSCKMLGEATVRGAEDMVVDKAVNVTEAVVQRLVIKYWRELALVLVLAGAGVGGTKKGLKIYRELKKAANGNSK